MFRVQNGRVYFVRYGEHINQVRALSTDCVDRESIANLATSVSRAQLLSLGTCVGKFTKTGMPSLSLYRSRPLVLIHTGKFRMHITALDIVAPHARYKVWVKPNGEMPFLYGGNVVKAHVGRWSEDCPEHQGIAPDDTCY